MATAPPPAVRRWLASNYGAHFQIADEWLEGCWAYVAEQHTTIQLQLKALDEQIRLASLETTIEAPVLPAEVVNHDPSQPQDIRIATDAPMLLEIIELTEIGHSANSLRDIHEERKEERRIERAGGDVANARIVRMDDAEDEAGGENGLAELPKDGEEERQKAPKFPRAMVRLRLSDGHNSVPAIEYRRIAGFSLEDTPLGCKLLVKNVRVLRGILLLEPRCVTIKGGHVADLIEQADAIFEAGLRFRMGEPEPEQPEPAPEAEQAPPPPIPRAADTPVRRPAAPAAAPPPRARPPAPPRDDFDDDMDIDDELLAQAADEVERRSSASPSVVRTSSADAPARAFPGTDKYSEARKQALARLQASRAAKAKSAFAVGVDSGSSGKSSVAKAVMKRPAAPIELSSD